MENKLIPITENFSVVAPVGLTPEQEQAWIVQYKKEHDVATMEAEYLQLLKDRDEGKLVSADEVLPVLEAMNQSTERESA